MSNRVTYCSKICVLAVVAVVYAGSVPAQQIKSGELILDHAWARATPNGAKVGGGYLTIENKGATPDKLLGGSSPVTGQVEVHEMALKNGVMTMRPVKDGLPIPAGKAVSLSPG